LSESDRARLAGSVDLFVNVAAQVDFTPPLDKALRTNVEGALNGLELARALGVPMVHVSTCYVAGYAEGAVREGIVPDAVPDASVTDFDPEAELIRMQRLVARIQEDRDDPVAPPWRRRLR